MPRGRREPAADPVAADPGRPNSLARCGRIGRLPSSAPIRGASGNAARVNLTAPFPPVSWTRSPLLPQGILWVALWSLLSLVEVQGYVHSPMIPLWEPVALVAVSAATVAAWLLLELRSARYLQPALEPGRRWFLHQLRRLPLVLTGYFVVVFGLRQVSFTIGGAEYVHLPWPPLIVYESVKVTLFYCLWLGLVYGTLSLLRWREQSARLLEVQKVLIEAQLGRLQAQLRPHFLFNTLNTVSALMHSDVRRADRVLTHLGELLRASLTAGERDAVPLQEEVRLLGLYADIMRERFGDRLLLEWDIPPELLKLEVPAMLMQPLFENAFKHGVERSLGIERIRVSARREGHRLVLEIHNSGSVLDPQWRPGVGLSNCRERLRVRFGADGSCDLAAGADGGVVARVGLPLDRSDA